MALNPDAWHSLEHGPEKVDRQGAPPLKSPAIELARAAAGGDVQAISGVIRDVGPRVSNVVRGVLGGSHPDLDDVVQQALIALVQALPAFRGECEPAGYASRIAVRVAVAARRKARARALRNETMDGQGELPSSAPTPEGLSVAARRTELVRELLAQIPEEQAECLALRVVLGWSLEEVADACGIPMNTVRSRVRLAKEALRKRIEADPRLAEDLEVGR